MKFYLLFLSSIFVFSCSSNPENIVPVLVSLKVVKKITLSTLNNDEENPQFEITVSDFAYQNGQINKITLNDYETKIFEYDGNKITKIKKYYDNVLHSENKFIYLNDVLVSNSYIDNGAPWLLNKFVIEDDKLQNVSYGDGPPEPYNLSEFLYVANNVSERKQSFPYYYSKSRYSDFDSKNNPYRNQNKYFKTIFSNWSPYGDDKLRISSNENNPMTEMILSYDDALERTLSYTIQYDSDNFPIKIEGKDILNNQLIVKYEYEYTVL